MKVQKTNAARLLDKLNINYELISYEVEESDLSAVHVAKTLQEPIDQVFKTLVLKGDKSGYFIFIVPGAEDLDLKTISKISGNKNCHLIPMKDLIEVTGYIRGACSPIGMKKKFPTYINKTCSDFDFIYVSGGTRGLQIKIAPLELIKATGAVETNLCNNNNTVEPTE